MTQLSVISRAVLGCALAHTALAQAALAQNPDSARAIQATPTIGPPIRHIATASALSKEKLGSIVSVRELPDGRVLLNDGLSRRLLLLDTNLVTERVVLDSLAENENTYGNRQGALLPFRADSSIFIDMVSLALLVIDPSGNITRVRSVPRANDAYWFASGQSQAGVPGTDPKGRLVYRMYAQPTPPTKPPPKGVPWFPEEPDSAFVVALDFDSRKVDTLASFHIPKPEYVVTMAPGGQGFLMYSMVNPMPSTDDWAVLPDGAVALVRGIDYRIDYRNADGTRTSSGRIPFDWQPMSDSAKERLVDSVRTAQNKAARVTYVSAMIRWVNTYRRKYPANFIAPEGYTPPNGFAKSWAFPPGVTFPEKYIYACAPGEEAKVAAPAGGDGKPMDAAAVAAAERAAMMASMGVPPSMLPGMPGGGTPSCIPQPIPNLAQIPNPPTTREVKVVQAKLLPDFRPPFNASSVRADLDGNLWIRTNPAKPVPGGAVFDVVNRSGQLVDRMQLPPNYSLVGFGRGKVVFLSMRDAQGPHLARVRLK